MNASFAPLTDTSSTDISLIDTSLVKHAGHFAQLADFNQNKVTPGLIGFVVFAAIGGACWLLMKSMNKQFKKIDFEEPPQVSTETDADGGASRASGAETA